METTTTITVHTSNTASSQSVTTQSKQDNNVAEKTQFQLSLERVGLELHLPDGVTFQDLEKLSHEELMEEIGGYKFTSHQTEKELENLQSLTSDQMFNDVLHDTATKWLAGFENRDEKFNTTFFDSFSGVYTKAGKSLTSQGGVAFDPSNPLAALEASIRKPIQFSNTQEVYDFIDTFIHFYESNLEWAEENKHQKGLYYLELNAQENIDFFTDVKHEYRKRINIQKAREEEARELQATQQRDAALNRAVINS